MPTRSSGNSLLACLALLLPRSAASFPGNLPKSGPAGRRDVPPPAPARFGDAALAARGPPTPPDPSPSQAPSLRTLQEQQRICLGLQKALHLFDLQSGHSQAGDSACPLAQTEPTAPPDPGTLGVPQIRWKFLPGKGSPLLWQRLGAGSPLARTLLCCLYSRNAALPRKKCFISSFACKGKEPQQCQLFSLSQRRRCPGELHLREKQNLSCSTAELGKEESSFQYGQFWPGLCSTQINSLPPGASNGSTTQGGSIPHRTP